LHCVCLLLGVKRTCAFALQMSAFDPKRTSRLLASVLSDRSSAIANLRTLNKLRQTIMVPARVFSIGIGDFICPLSGVRSGAASCVGNRLLLRERFTVWPENISAFVFVCQRSIQLGDGATWCAATRKLATATTYGSGYKVTLFIGMTSSPVSLNANEVRVENSPQAARDGLAAALVVPFLIF
jgi:hypothetical protein